MLTLRKSAAIFMRYFRPYAAVVGVPWRPLSLDWNTMPVTGIVKGSKRRRCRQACYWRCNVSRIIESLRDDLAALHEAGAVTKVTMREFDAICPPPVREFSAADIRHLRETLKFSQPVFALHLHTTASTVRKWEQGETRPAGPALKLLNVIADKGLQAII
jgi:putative transcriptional regulator